MERPRQLGAARSGARAALVRVRRSEDVQARRAGSRERLLRRIDNREGGDIEALQGTVDKISYTVFGARGNKLTTGAATVNALGGFDTKFKIPSAANLGYARLTLSAKGKGSVSHRSFNHTFRIQEFRRPEFEVSASASQGPHKVGGSANVTVKAKYYAGGGLPNAEVNWTVSSSVGSFTPPNRKGYVFGSWTPWWGFRHGQAPRKVPNPAATKEKQTPPARTSFAWISFRSIRRDRCR